MTAAAAIASDLLGPIDVEPDQHFTFEAGLYGFPGARDFALVPTGRPGLTWLQSAEEPGLTFLLADPFRAFAGYAPDVPEAELAQLGGGRVPAPEQVALLVIVTLGGRGTASANLRAPVVLDVAGRRGRQVVLPGEPHGMQEPLALA